MASGVHVWSSTASSNGNVDSTVNFAEGQAPSSVNDSARAVMAEVAKYRKDTAGTLTTAGSSTAYTIASPNATYASLSELDGVQLKVKFNATNGAAPTLNVNSLGAKAIQTAVGTAVPAGYILANSIHDLTYDNSNSAWVLSGAFAPALVVMPVGGMLDYAGDTAPSGWLLCYGQSLVRADYAALFTAIGTTHGSADGTHFTLPDCRGRVVAGQDDMGGSSANRLTGVSGGIDGDVLGGVGGVETHTLTEAQLASHTHTVNVTDTHQHFIFADETDADGLPAPSSSNYVARALSAGSSSFNYGMTGTDTAASVGRTSTTGAGSITAAAVATGSGTAHNNVQPTIILNKIIYTGVYA